MNPPGGSCKPARGGYLMKMKDEPIASVLQAIRKIHAGHLVASRALSSELIYKTRLMSKLDVRTTPELKALYAVNSTAEFKVLRLGGAFPLRGAPRLRNSR
ncbi:MAG: hypothetical protein WCT12_03080 [Verrucomicrobiota bacterium]